MATTSSLASPGLASGLDINAIVEKLMAVERRPLQTLATRESATKERISAYGQIKSALAALQTAAASVSSVAPFRSTLAQVSDPAVFTASTGDGAVAGRYDIEVSALARAQKLASSGFAAATDVVGTGTLTFEFGTTSGTTFTPDASLAARTVTIAAGQDSLSGVRDAVNAAKIGVTATIVDDGSATGKRLVFTSDASGAARSMRIGVADDDAANGDAAGLSRLAWDPAGTPGAGKNLEQKAVAQDAAFSVDGIAITSSSNTVGSAIAGVTLNLAGETDGTPATLVIGRNGQAAAVAMQTFVKAYNDAATLLDALTRYDATARKASTLTGDSTARSVQTQLRGLLSAAAQLVPGKSLADAGITSQRDGRLAFDPAKLDALLASDASSVESMFAALGKASDARVSVSGLGSATAAGTYSVDVTTLARSASVEGGAAAALAYTAGVDDALTATVDGKSVGVTLAASYASAATLAADVASKLNGALAQAGSAARVRVGSSGGVLKFESTTVGAVSTLTLSGTAVAALVGASPVSTSGSDVAGTIGGVAAYGIGNLLTAPAGSPAAGLRLLIDGATTGPRGNVEVTLGAGARLGTLLTDLLESDGLLDARTDGLERSLSDLAKQKSAIDRRLEQVEAAYRRQFNALDATIATLNTTSSYLEQQLANLPKIGPSS